MRTQQTQWIKRG